MSRSFESLSRIIEILADEGPSKLVVVHHNGDPDAVGSAIALKQAFPNVDVAAPLGVSLPAKRLLQHLGHEVLERPPYDEYDYVILVDTSGPVQLGEHAKHIREPIIIDHHPYHDTWKDALYLYVDPSKASCCEVVVEVIERAHDEDATPIAFDGTCTDIQALETVGLALLTGIWTDTAGFRHAHPGTFAATARLLTATGTSMGDVLAILEQEPEFHDGKRTAHYKAAQRMTHVDIGPLSVALSHVSAFEASAARALTLLGADVAFCVADTKDEIRASARARRSATAHHGVRLGHLMNHVGKLLGFMGGGHDGAAGMNLPKRDAQASGVAIPATEEVLDALVSGLREQLQAPHER